MPTIIIKINVIKGVANILYIHVLYMCKYFNGNKCTGVRIPHLLIA